MNSSLGSISIRGKNKSVPSLKFGDKEIVVTGKLLKIARIKDEFYIDGIEDPLTAVKKIKASDLHADIFTFWQQLPELEPKYRFYREWDNVAAIKVSTFDDWWKNQLTDKGRNKVRKSRRMGVDLRKIAFSDDLVRSIQNIFNESPIRQGKRFWHYGKSFDMVKMEMSRDLDQSEFVGAYYKNDLIGFIKIMYFSNVSAHLTQIISKIEHRDKGTNNALIAKAVEICEQNHIPFLIYANYHYANKGDDSLTIFKRQNGFRKIELPRYFIPITVKGKILLKLKLHREIIEILPGPILKTLLSIREKINRRLFGNA